MCDYENLITSNNREYLNFLVFDFIYIEDEILFVFIIYVIIVLFKHFHLRLIKPPTIIVNGTYFQ